MKKPIVIGAFLALAFANGVAAAAPYLERMAKDGSTIAVWDIEKGKLPPFVFIGSKIKAKDAAFFCSKSTGAVWARIDGKSYAVNKAASNKRERIGEDGVAIDTIPAGAPGNIVTSDADVATRVLAQAERACNPEPITPHPLTAVDAAYAICQAVDQTGDTTEPCAVSVWSQRIDISMDVTASGGKQVCREVKAFVSKKRWDMRGWEVYVSSPYSGKKSVAFCRL